MPGLALLWGTPNPAFFTSGLNGRVDDLQPASRNHARSRIPHVRTESSCDGCETFRAISPVLGAGSSCFPTVGYPQLRYGMPGRVTRSRYSTRANHGRRSHPQLPGSSPTPVAGPLL